ncbi:unnamed protein product [Amoebophrya sp. A25]|nr:unnamed protein product [Amoebophrya sp. A25]|eukprot:GSA25T00018501001.1
MGLVLSTLWRKLLGAEGAEYKIVLVGLNNAGKTTILYRLSLGQPVITQPTIGCNVEELSYKGVKFTAWDLGGQEKLRDLWPSYFKSDNFADAIIFVVDSNDVESLVTAKMELMNILILHNVRTTVKAVLVFANKQDISGARTAADLVADLSLAEIKTHDWQIMPCCALTGEGVDKGMDWLVNKLTAATSAKPASSQGAGGGGAAPSTSHASSVQR